MAMSLQEVSAIFSRIDFKHELDEENDVIFSVGADTDSILAYFVRLHEDGELFDMSARLLSDNNIQINAKESEHVKVLMHYLLLRNYELKFGTWQFDIEDGAVSFAVEVPLEDNHLTKKQVKKIVNIMLAACEEAALIKHILKHGSLPIENEKTAKKITELETLL